MTDNDDPRWMTFKQAESKGYHIKKGSVGERITFFKSTEERLILGEDGKPELDEDGNEKKEKIQLEKGISSIAIVFNAKDIEGIPPLEIKVEEREFTPIEQGERILQNSGANIIHGAINRAFYRLSTDSIHLPHKETFKSEQGYYSTTLHELAHWTGHESRLNREFGATRSSKKCAKEELRAEIGSWFISKELDLPDDKENHQSYIASWAKEIKKDPFEVIRACRDAEKIKDYVLSLDIEQEQEKQQNKAERALTSDEKLTLASAQEATLKMPMQELQKVAEFNSAIKSNLEHAELQKITQDIER